ncbi:hypothetical protein BaRGS_00026472 [Batillaria attramentaria]|uniref:Uncharacterized protein n=1 Tax=Batillaria attramentaria TaxID=370345 RepID=A0ABD0K549_9CAEN
MPGVVCTISADLAKLHTRLPVCKTDTLGAYLVTTGAVESRVSKNSLAPLHPLTLTPLGDIVSQLNLLQVVARPGVSSWECRLVLYMHTVDRHRSVQTTASALSYCCRSCRRNILEDTKTLVHSRPLWISADS